MADVFYERTVHAFCAVFEAANVCGVKTRSEIDADKRRAERGPDFASYNAETSYLRDLAAENGEDPDDDGEEDEEDEDDTVAGYCRSLAGAMSDLELANDFEPRAEHWYTLSQAAQTLMELFYYLKNVNRITRALREDLERDGDAIVVSAIQCMFVDAVVNAQGVVSIAIDQDGSNDGTLECESALFRLYQTLTNLPLRFDRNRLATDVALAQEFLVSATYNEALAEQVPYLDPFDSHLLSEHMEEEDEDDREEIWSEVADDEDEDEDVISQAEIGAGALETLAHDLGFLLTVFLFANGCPID